MIEFTNPLEIVQWLRRLGVVQLQINSRHIQQNDAFIAWPGAASDGRQFVLNAFQNGALACVVEQEGLSFFEDQWQKSNPLNQKNLPIACYKGLKAATAEIAALWFDEPSKHLDIFAVTGTNGKTSTVWWLSQVLSQLNPTWAKPCAMIGTLGIRSHINLDSKEPLSHIENTGLTTPDPVLLQKQFRYFVDNNIKACAIEASSIGLVEHRLDHTHIRVAIFTNFTQDHLDYHANMQAYAQAKKSLFDWKTLKTAVINIDDSLGMEWAQELIEERPDLDVWTISAQYPARLKASHLHYNAQRGLAFTVEEHSPEIATSEYPPKKEKKDSKLSSYGMQTDLIGSFNVHNLLGVIAALRSLGIPLEIAANACQYVQPVPGRMDCQGGADQPLVVVDYAHTPDALEKTLQALRMITKERLGRLWCVFGCGGDRDSTKRPLMAAVAEKNADTVVITSDNPRKEKPEAIISQILLGLSHHQCVHVQADRAKAIEEAISQAQPNDVILIAGKGHEAYQEIMGVQHPFSDQEHVANCLKSLKS